MNFIFQQREIIKATYTLDDYMVIIPIYIDGNEQTKNKKLIIKKQQSSTALHETVYLILFHTHGNELTFAKHFIVWHNFRSQQFAYNSTNILQHSGIEWIQYSSGHYGHIQFGVYDEECKRSIHRYVNWCIIQVGKFCEWEKILKVNIYKIYMLHSRDSESCASTVAIDSKRVN